MVTFAMATLLFGIAISILAVCFLTVKSLLKRRISVTSNPETLREITTKSLERQEHDDLQARSKAVEQRRRRELKAARRATLKNERLARAIIAAIPRLAAFTAHSGRWSVGIMKLEFRELCRPELLSGAAKLVYAHCEAEKLNPYLCTASDGHVWIFIHWKKEDDHLDRFYL